MLTNIVNIGCEIKHLHAVSMCNQLLVSAACSGHIQNTSALIPLAQIPDRN